MKARQAGGAALADARRRLGGLRDEAARTQALLTRLQADLAQANNDWDASHAARLLEANENLVVSALLAHQGAETAALALEHAVQAADRDPLTGLPNRALMHDRFEHAIAKARRRGTRLALLFVDLDSFKSINDALGHAVGDEVLVRAAGSLVGVVRESDTVSRHGGDEFLILLGELSQLSDAARIAGKVIAALSGLTCAGGQVSGLHASVGISIYPDDGDRPDALIALADAAMYRAKRDGGGGVVSHGEPKPSGLQPVAPSPPAPAHRQLDSDRVVSPAVDVGDALQAANERLVLSALSAQELLAAAQRKLRRQSEALARVTHELLNPLAAVRTATAVAVRVSTTEERLPAMHRVIERQVVQMSRLLGDLLDVSRSETGKMRLETKTVEFDRIVEEAAETAAVLIEARSQRFDVRLAPGPLLVRGDAVRLSQVLRNLLDNASKYTPDGGTVGLGVERRDDAVVVTVSDSGIGIVAEALPDVFEPFFQDQRATAFNRGGLGLGLTVVRELVQAHGGTVAAFSGRGSRFVMTLPLLSTAARQPQLQ